MHGTATRQARYRHSMRAPTAKSLHRPRSHRDHSLLRLQLCDFRQSLVRARLRCAAQLLLSLQPLSTLGKQLLRRCERARLLLQLCRLRLGCRAKRAQMPMNGTRPQEAASRAPPWVLKSALCAVRSATCTRRASLSFVRSMICAADERMAPSPKLGSDSEKPIVPPILAGTPPARGPPRNLLAERRPAPPRGNPNSRIRAPSRCGQGLGVRGTGAGASSSEDSELDAAV